MDISNLIRPPEPGIEDTLSSISSPKRKRDQDLDSDDDHPRASPMRFRAELPTRPRTGDDSVPTSPRSKVSRQLYVLKLDKPDPAFSTPLAAFGQGNSSVDSSGSWNTSSPPTDPEPESLLVNSESPTSLTRTVRKDDIPPTSVPSLASITEPTKLPEIIPSTTGKRPSTSPRMRSPPPLASPSNTRKRSPAPAPYTDLTWTPSEITGHNPTDSADDGYGINGVGFRPTPAMAQARSQRRKQQVAEWKIREAKEARQKRIDRRRKVSTTETDKHGSGNYNDDRRKVRFVDI